MFEKEAEEIKKRLEGKKKIVVVSHKNPDGDAIGSSLALKNFLEPMGHKVTVMVPDQPPYYLSWLAGFKDLITFDNCERQCKEKVQAADLIFCVDFNALHRIGELGEVIGAAKGEKIMIDHHPGPSDFADIRVWFEQGSSTAELVYKVVEQMGMKDKISLPVAESIYTGLLTDTGSFRFSSTSSDTHAIASHLLEVGVNSSDIYEKIYDNNTENRLRLLGFCLSEKLKVFPEFSAAYITLTLDELNHFQYRKGDTEGVVNYALSLKGIKMAAFFREDGEMIRISFRSKGKFSVNDFARDNFGGGGHFNAAGGSSAESLDDTILKFLSLLPKYKEQLQNA